MYTHIHRPAVPLPPAHAGGTFRHFPGEAIICIYIYLSICLSFYLGLTLFPVRFQLTAHDIANRILRKENYMVGLVNRGLLPLEPLPFLPSLCMLTKTLEWNLEVDRPMCL